MRKKITNSGIFCFISIVGIISTFIMINITHGEIISQMFWHDTIDTGMDFFHSIEYIRGGVPYEKFETLYPPLANLFFYMLYHMIPKDLSSQWADSYSESMSRRGTGTDLRIWQSPMLLFILFIIISVTILYKLILDYLEDNHISFYVFVSIILSYGMLYAYERGNVIIVTFIFSAFFVFYRNSENKVKKELALISLAIATGLKMYPVFLGVLLLYDKDVKVVTRTICYGILFFFAPFLCFQERMKGIGIFIRVLSEYSKDSKIVYTGFSVDKIINSFVCVIENITGKVFQEACVLNIGRISNYIIVILILICGYFFKENWKKVLCCCCAMISYSTQAIYIIIFMFLPLLVLFHEENETIKRSNVVIVVLLSLMTVLLPLGDLEIFDIAITYLRLQLNNVFIIGYILIEFMKMNIHRK